MTPLFEACAEATEEAILNALCMATTTTGIEGAHARPAAGRGCERYAECSVIGSITALMLVVIG